MTPDAGDARDAGDAGEQCAHLEREDGVCTACGHCLHEVILNGVCYFCGTADIDALAVSPKPQEQIVPAKSLVRRKPT